MANVMARDSAEFVLRVAESDDRCNGRMVAETVLRTAMMCMAESEDQDVAVASAIHTLHCNAMHLSLLPVLVERFIHRTIMYEPLLGMATLGITMNVPVVSMKSIMQVRSSFVSSQ